MEQRSGIKFGKGMSTTVTVGDNLRVAENDLDGRGSFEELLFSPILVPDLNCDRLLKAVNEGRKEGVERVEEENRTNAHSAMSVSGARLGGWCVYVMLP